MPSQKEYTPQEREQALEDFEMFLFYMDDVLEAFIDQVEETGVELDYSLDSLDRLETYLIEQEAQPLSDLHGHSSQYVGEVARKNFGGKWILSLDMKENSLYYGKPVVVGHTQYDVQFAPYSIVATFLRRRLEGLLKRAIVGQVTPPTFNLDHLPTEDPIED
jgi:hypothetical protein